jgi:hypothetical protein
LLTYRHLVTGNVRHIYLLDSGAALFAFEMPAIPIWQHALAADALLRWAVFPGTAVRAHADHSARLRKRLRHTGTRSATRRLIVVSGRERRLKRERNHVIRRRIVDSYPHARIGREDLTYIRERTERRHGKRASQKQRNANGHASTWAFAELQG